jgi:hypothetical protein
MQLTGRWVKQEGSRKKVDRDRGVKVVAKVRKSRQKTLKKDSREREGCGNG